MCGSRDLVDWIPYRDDSAAAQASRSNFVRDTRCRRWSIGEAMMIDPRRTRDLIAPCAALMIASSAACTPSPELADRAQAIELGQPESGYVGVGETRPLIDTNDTCTGTLISPSVVLTAAHCATEPAIRFSAGYDRGGGAPPTNERRLSDRIAVHPFRDLALLHVVTMDAQPEALWLGAHPAIGASCLAVGYGHYTDEFGQVREHTRRSAYETIEIWDDLVTVDLGAGIADHGDSGGPLLCADPMRGGALSISAAVKGHDGDWPFYHRENYTPIDVAWIETTLLGWEALDAPLTCQQLSDRYAMSPTSAGFAPAEVQASWAQRGCQTAPVSPESCLRASELYGIDEAGFGLAPAGARAWWTSQGCATSPLHPAPLCQRLADNFGVVSGYTIGSMPAEVETLYLAAGCAGTSRAPRTACQSASDLFGITASDPGWAPVDVVAWFAQRGCRTAPAQPDRCRLATDTYGIDPSSARWAPAELTAWFAQHQCATWSRNDVDVCQLASERYGISNDDYGFAPAEIAQIFSQSECGTRNPLGLVAPLTSDLCQLASDRYGIAAHGGSGFAPADVRTWFSSHGCATRPRP
jgi:hypothetical protein